MGTETQAERHQREKAFLRGYFPDYDARRHDAFVLRWRREQDAVALEAWYQARVRGEQHGQEWPAQRRAQ